MGLAEVTVDEAAIVARVDAAIERAAERVDLTRYDLGEGRKVTVKGRRVVLISKDGSQGYTVLLDVPEEDYMERYHNLMGDLNEQGRSSTGSVFQARMIVVRWRKI